MQKRKFDPFNGKFLIKEIRYFTNENMDNDMEKSYLANCLCFLNNPEYVTFSIPL